MSLEDKSDFKIFKEFLNSLEEGQGFTRQCYLMACRDTLTIDQYRKGLQDAGFLERVGKSGQGKYKKVKDIPDYIKSSNYRNKKFLEKIEMQNKLKIL